MFDIEDYNYDLPEELVAQVPALSRSNSRLLVVERSRESFSSHYFFELPGLLRPEDLLVVNNTRVVPARLLGRKETGGHIEVLVLEHPRPDACEPNKRWCLWKSSRRPKKGSLLIFEGPVYGIVEDTASGGLVKIAFQGEGPLDSLIEEKGLMPLPPYIRRSSPDDRAAMDRERYQTVYSRIRGAVAAPTAGLHFTEGLLRELEDNGVSMVEVTLHVGHGTFKPVREQDIRKHELGTEIYIIDPEAATAINRAKEKKRRILAVGTTVVRALETAVDAKGTIIAGKGSTDLLIVPGHRFKVVDALITNFHLPRSSLLFLVAAFAGLDLVKKAYGRAIEDRFRFYSYGDAMLIT
jgi:S-adenosylmethionine:tRNA ribosyltransferase-isomerase